MPCFHPLQASFTLGDSGKKKLNFSSRASSVAAEAFVKGSKLSFSNIQFIPCGKCMGCRLERSRQWAVRCMHEASMFEDNCFLTLTYSPENVPADGSLDKSVYPAFMKRLRECYSDFRMKYFMCGEYGEQLGRPHYHSCLFGFDFPDKKPWKRVSGGMLYVSAELERLWKLGFCTIGSLTFDSAAYVARYCTKKINGDMADAHYQGRQPEFSLQSNKPGIGASWYDKWKRDCFPSDYLVVNGAKCKPPRYYEKKLEKEDPLLFEAIKLARVERAMDDDDSTHRRLLDREKCQEARFKKLIRTIERSYVCS